MSASPRFSAGQRVRIRDAKIDGMIDRIAISIMDGIEYRVLYWHDGGKREAWCYEAEVEPLPDGECF